MGLRLLFAVLLLDVGEADPLEAALREIGRAASDLSPLALLSPEIEGQDADLEPLTARVAEVLGAGRKVLLPEAVRVCAGQAPGYSAQGVGGVARRCGARAALFLRLTVSSEGIELSALLADEQNRLLLDQAFPLPDLRLVRPRTQVLAAPPAPEQASPEWAASPEQADPRANFATRSLALEEAPAGLFRVMQAGQSIGELQLVRAVGDDLRIAAIQAQIDDLRFPRRLGIGLTLGGFIAAGLSLPLLKADESGQITGGVFLGTGLLAAAAGLWVWLAYGEEVTAGGPQADRNLLTREEAVQLIERYNGSLRRELGL